MRRVPRWNLAAPARVFLGDGGSLPLGLVLATVAMGIATGPKAAGIGALVWAARWSCRCSTPPSPSSAGCAAARPSTAGGRDHLTHALLARLGIPRRVAMALGIAQAIASALAIAARAVGGTAQAALAAVWERRSWERSWPAIVDQAAGSRASFRSTPFCGLSRSARP